MHRFQVEASQKSESDCGRRQGDRHATRQYQLAELVQLQLVERAHCQEEALQKVLVQHVAGEPEHRRRRQYIDHVKQVRVLLVQDADHTTGRHRCVRGEGSGQLGHWPSRRHQVYQQQEHNQTCQLQMLEAHLGEQ